MSDLQSKLGEGLNTIQDSYQQGKQKLQTAQEIGQYNKSINENLEKRAELILDLGEEVYRKIRSGELQEDSLMSISNSIIALDQTIFKAKKVVEQLSGKSQQSKHCPDCGIALTPGDKFCGSCGSKVEETPTVSTSETTQCLVCQEEVPSNGNFCSCCGNRLARY